MAMQVRFPVGGVVTALLLTCLSGCSDATTAPQPVIDQSLTVDEYSRWGMPSIKGAWTADDMVAASNALSGSFTINPAHLPRFQSSRSGELFAKLTSPENFRWCTDKSIPLPK